MEFILNNRKENIDKEKISISELLKEKNFTFKLLVIKINDKLIKKEERETAFIFDGDKVTVLHMISGG